MSSLLNVSLAGRFVGKNGFPRCDSGLLFFVRDGKGCWAYKIGVSVCSQPGGGSCYNYPLIKFFMSSLNFQKWFWI